MRKGVAKFYPFYALSAVLMLCFQQFSEKLPLWLVLTRQSAIKLQLILLATQGFIFFFTWIIARHHTDRVLTSMSGIWALSGVVLTLVPLSLHIEGAFGDQEGHMALGDCVYLVLLFSSVLLSRFTGMLLEKGALFREITELNDAAHAVPTGPLKVTFVSAIQINPWITTKDLRTRMGIYLSAHQPKPGQAKEFKTLGDPKEHRVRIPDLIRPRPANLVR